MRKLGAKPTSLCTYEGLIICGLQNSTILLLDPSSNLRTVGTITGQHTEAVNSLVIRNDMLFSGSSKVVRTDLGLLTGRGAIVASIDLNDSGDGLKRFMQLTKPMLDFRFKAVLLTYTTVQLASFGFNEATVPENKELHEALAWTRELGVSAEGLFPAMFASACGVVIVFIVVMLTQEAVEWKKFTQPNSKAWKYLWLAMSIFTQLMATALFVPVCRTLVRAGDCTHDRETGRWWLDAMAVSERTLRPSFFLSRD